MSNATGGWVLAIGSITLVGVTTLAQRHRQIWIGGGRSSTADQFSNVPNVRSSGGDCSGVLVAETVVITAAHCLPATAPATVSVESNDWMRNETGHRCAADEGSDLALVKLDERPSRNGNKLGRLPTQTLFPQTKKVTGVGWGEMGSENGHGGAEHVRKPTYANADVHVDSTDARYFVATGKTACKGDSGGPAFIPGSDTIAGIDLKFDGTAQCGQASRYIRVDIDPVRSWLSERIASCAMTPTQ